MGGYSDNREKNMELKYLRKVLSEVDKDIAVPDSVRGKALRSKLDSVKPGTYWPEMLRSLVGHKPRLFDLQSGLTYAVAFAVIIGIAYFLGMHSSQPEFVPMESPAQEMAEDVRIDANAQEAEAAAAAAEAQNSVAEAEASAVQDARVQDSPREDGLESPVVGGADEALGVGGASPSTHLATVEGYSLNMRRNDASDPDKGEYPITIDVVGGDLELASQIDIPDMQTIEACYVQEDSLVLVGSDGQNTIARTYSLEEMDNPREEEVLHQPGQYVGSRIQDGIVLLATQLEEGDGAAVDGEEELPGATGETRCILSAIDPASGEAVTRSFVGADGVILLDEDGVTLTYTAQPGQEEAEENGAESEEEVQRTVQIYLQGMELLLDEEDQQ